jgi:hypothetical protein
LPSSLPGRRNRSIRSIAVDSIDSAWLQKAFTASPTPEVDGARLRVSDGIRHRLIHLRRQVDRRSAALATSRRQATFDRSM